MQKRFIIFFFVLTLIIGALGYTPWVLASHGLLQWPVVLAIIFIIIGGGSPTFAAVIVTRLEYGKNGPNYIFKQFSLRKTARLWFPVSVLLPVAIVACVIMIWLLFGKTYTLDPGELPQFLPILISNFAVNMWEEVGWRGYALPALQRKYSALVASLVLGAVWALWHWPLFAVLNSQMAVNYHNSYLLFVGVTVFISIIYTWLYNSSGGSLLIVSIFHATTNTANYLLFTRAGIAYDAAIFYFITVAALAVVLVAVFGPRYLSRRVVVPTLMNS